MKKNNLKHSFLVSISAVFVFTFVFAGHAMAAPAEIQSPASGSTLGSTTETFTWDDSGAEQYWLRVGTTNAGSFDIYSNDQGTNTSREIPDLPDSGETVYVRLFSMIDGGWAWNDYTYTACDCASQTSAMQSPVPGSALGSTTETFVWNDAGAEQYWLRIGTTEIGSFDVYSNDQGINTSKTVSDLPAAGETLYVRLFSMIGGDWFFNDYTSTACSLADTATIQSPVPDSIFGSTTETFVWNDTGVEQYWLRIGTAGAGSFDVYSNDQGTNTSKTVSDLPAAGEIVYVRLFSMIDGDWLYND